MDVKSERERRHEERVRRYDLAAYCTTGPLGDAPHDVSRGLLDISTSGARLLLETSVAVGESLTVTLAKASLRRSVNVTGEVRWTSSLPDGRCVAGVRFPRVRGILELLL